LIEQRREGRRHMIQSHDSTNLQVAGQRVWRPADYAKFEENWVRAISAGDIAAIRKAVEDTSLPWHEQLADVVATIDTMLGRQAKASLPPPDGLRTPVEAARKLRCSIKTLNGHVASGALRYVVIGHGTKRPRRMFADTDLDDFIANQTRKDVPCPSISTETVARRISTSTSKCEVIGFTARRNARRAAKPKK